MQYTENYNLNKPELTDVADITKISDNMDIIDEELEKRTTKLGFLTDLITHLASDAAIAISSLSTDSVFYRLLQYALNAAGVQYNFQNANAWYICLGALFGGLIIQGGLYATSTAYGSLDFPITFRHKVFNVVACEGHASGANWTNAVAFDEIGVNYSADVITGFSFFIMWASHGGNVSAGGGTMSWIAMGI